MFKSKKRQYEVINEEECKEEWGKRKKLRRSYIKSVPSKKIEKVFDSFKVYLFSAPNEKKRASSIVNSGVKKAKIDESLETQVVLPQADIEILTDLDVLAVGNLDFLLPPFKPLSNLGKTNICKEFGLNFVKSITTTYENRNNKIFNLNELVPISTYQVPKMGIV